MLTKEEKLEALRKAQWSMSQGSDPLLCVTGVEYDFLWAVLRKAVEAAAVLAEALLDDDE